MVLLLLLLGAVLTLQAMALTRRWSCVVAITRPIQTLVEPSAYKQLAPGVSHSESSMLCTCCKLRTLQA